MEKIQLLDRELYDKADLIKKMEDDEFYYGEMSKKALSSSSIKLLLSSPKTYDYVSRYGNAESQALRDGWLMHTAILEPEVFEAQTFIDVQSKNTKKFKLAKEELGKVFTTKEKHDAERVADAVLRNEKALQLLNDSEFEVPIAGEVMGYPFRAKADILGNGRICDLKSTSDIKAFPYSAKKYGYDVQVFLYCELFGVPYDKFEFLVIDKGSLDIGVWGVSEEFYGSGKEKTKEGIDRYHNFFELGMDLDNYYIEGTL
jgi:hypothetical protein